MRKPPDKSPTFVEATSRYYRRYDVLAAYVPELIAMKSGQKTSIQLSLQKDASLGPRLDQLRDFCERTGFHLATREEAGEVKVLLANRPLPTGDFHDKGDLGRLLSYPSCCVDHCIGQDLVNPLIDHIGDLLVHGDWFPYWMNLFLRTAPFHLYKHYPCSLTCEATGAQAQALLGSIAEANPLLFTDLMTFLPGPVLYTDICGAGISLVGEPSTEPSTKPPTKPPPRGHGPITTVHYRSLYCDTNPAQVVSKSLRNTPDDVALFENLIALLGRGDRVTLDNDSCTVHHGDREVGRLERPAHLRWKIIVFTA